MLECTITSSVLYPTKFCTLAYSYFRLEMKWETMHWCADFASTTSITSTEYTSGEKWRLCSRQDCRYLYLFYAQQSYALHPFFPQLWHSTLKHFTLLLSSFHQSDTLWPYLTHFLRVTLKNLVLVFLLSPALNANTFLLVIFLLSDFHQVKSSKINEFISWDILRSSW